MNVPIVTPDDLASFHRTHFSESSQPSTDQSEQGFESRFEAFIEAQAEHYPDGQKRTLTDEQIAIFRHSEIQDIIKAFRYAAAQDDDDEDSTNDVSVVASENMVIPEMSSAAASSPSATVLKPFSVKVEKSKHGQNGEEGLSARQKQRSTQRWKNKKRQYKPPKQDVGTFKEEGEERTFRRICREADEVQTDTVDLDY